MRRLFFVLTLLHSAIAFSQPNSEFRGVWIATVDNIDWPQKGMYTVYSQKNRIYTAAGHASAKWNECRYCAGSRLPPTHFILLLWNHGVEWLTGRQGRSPSPYYDPLQFMIEETHKRGMEFHAWLNPYRANFDIRTSSIASNHITKIHPEWFLTYGDKKYFDPGNKQAQQHVINVVKDIVQRYNVDAIHMDDYFYPYRIAGKEFPDNASYKRSGSKLSKDDWRRSNVDSIIKALNAVIKEEKPLCKFGISPFGVWRNKEADPDRK